MLVCDFRGFPPDPTRLMLGASLGLACYPWCPGPDNKSFTLYIFIIVLCTMSEGVGTTVLCNDVALPKAGDGLSKHC